MTIGHELTSAHQAPQPTEAVGRPETPIQVRPAIVVEPVGGWAGLNLSEVWRYRELLYFLAWRDMKVRYKQATIGVAWAILQPLMTMVVFSVIFGYLAGLPSDDVPYPVFSYVGLLPWTFFAAAVSRSGISLVNDASLISKVYFPRLIVPMAAVLAASVDFAIAFVFLLGLMLFYGILPGIWLLSLPIFVLLALLTALGVGLWLAALNVRYRDVAHILPFLTQFWLFVTPVAYSVSIIPEGWRLIYGLNPMVGVVEGFRWALYGGGAPPGASIVASSLVALALVVSGLFYFRRTECEFADVV